MHTFFNDHWGRYPGGTPLSRLNDISNPGQADLNRTAMCRGFQKDSLLTDDTCDDVTEYHFDWFTKWVRQHLGLTLTFATGRSWQEMAVCFGAVPRVVGTATFLEAGQMTGARLRLGAMRTWT
jgi:hypothetical protein